MCKKRVVHCKKAPFDVYIGRPSKWGNPFPITPSCSREESISKYKKFLWGQIQAGEVSLEELAALHNKTLACWCAPKPCHGDVLTKAADWAHGKLNQFNQ